MPADATRCAISAVVVDLPLVPVMATNGASGAWRRRSRQNNSISPITSTPAFCASFTTQCGAGWVSGTPGASTSAAILLQSAWCRSAVGIPAASAFSRLAALSSQPTTSAPPASSACALDKPRTAQPEHGDLFAGKARDRDHDERYLSFKVESPASASTTETIQKRMTICGSVQPSCSK